MSGLLFYVWIGTAAALVLLLPYSAWQQAQRRRAGEVPAEGLLTALHPVDLESFSRAMRAMRGDRRVDRRRFAAAIGALRQMARNAAALQAAGYAHLRSANPLIQSFAQEMIDAGVSVRMYSLYLLAVLHIFRVLRSARMPYHILARMSGMDEVVSSSLRPAYELLRTSAGNLGAFKYPGQWQEMTSRL